jgi:uncharacterized protein (DUF58 family)
MIRRHPEVAGIFAADWDHWLVDEFQDTSPLQIELLRQLHGQGQEVLVFHVLAPEEEDLPYEGEFIMKDLESDQEVVVDADAFREEYRRRVNTFCDRIRQECLRLEADYLRIRTDQPLDAALIRYLERRAAV